MAVERTALVTGAGRGIGRATALALARAGVRVMAVSRTAADLARLADEARIESLVASVASAAGCEWVVREATRQLGRIDILVNNAGRGSSEEAEIWLQSSDVWHECFSVNVHAAFELTRLVSGPMRERNFGRIVMVSSTAAVAGGPRMSAYSSAKAAMTGLAFAAAHDLAPFGVTCNAVLPGWVRTDMADKAVDRLAKAHGRSRDDEWAAVAAGYPAGRVLVADEVASVIAFLCSPDASGISGEAIKVALAAAW